MSTAWIVADTTPDWLESFYAGGWEVKHFLPAGVAPPDPVSVPDPDLIIYDLGEKPPSDTFRRMCQDKIAPLVAITANWALAWKAIEVGADEVMIPPVNPLELLFRARKLIQSSKVVRVGDLAIDLAARGVNCAGRHLKLSPLEFRLLACLAKRIGQAVSHDELLDEVWGNDPERGGTVHQVKNCVSREDWRDSSGSMLGERRVRLCNPNMLF